MSGNLALIVDQTGATLERGTHGTVVLVHADGRRERIGLRALGSVVLYGNVNLSTGVLHALSVSNIALTMLPVRGHLPYTGFSQLSCRHATLRHQQHLAYAESSSRINLARRVVQAKLESMAAFARDYSSTKADEYYHSMQAMVCAGDIASLMGVEGAATLKHFGILAELFEQDGSFSFVKRSRQPPEDAVNAMMSLSYTMAQSLAVQLILHAGLDVQVGFLHGIHRDRPSLALDLIEPARAELDAWIFSLLRQSRVIKPAMFSQREDGSVWLTKEGRAQFYPAWYREGFRIALKPMRQLMAGMLAALRSQRSFSAAEV